MVDSKHSLYVKWLPRWKRCRDTAAGEDDVKEAGELYLPKPSGQNQKEYDAYRTRAYWFNATKRTIDGLTGLIFRRKPVIELPESMGDWSDDITMSGVSLWELAAIATDEVMIAGRAGILVDYPTVDIAGELTLAQAEASGARPYLQVYSAESITNWRTARRNGRQVLSMVVLAEQYEEALPADPFTVSTRDQYRVLEIDEAGSYRQTVYRKSTGGTFVQISQVWPVRKGMKFQEIPFYFIGVGRTDGTIEAPPISDLANVNLSHYRTLADLENGAHWTGLPTPVFVGLSDEKKVVELGSTAGITLPIGGDAKFLEFTGQGLEALERRAAAKAEEMAVLGARILAADKKAAEAAETAAIHRAGENSVLASIANTVSGVIQKALELARDWAGLTGDIKVKLNTDYMTTPMDAAMLTALTMSLQSGAISPVDYFAYLQRGEVIDADKTYEETQAEIAENPPAGLAMAAAIESARARAEADAAAGGSPAA